jgi:hypothetical protein
MRGDGDMLWYERFKSHRMYYSGGKGH